MIFDDLPKRASTARVYRKDLKKEPIEQLLQWLLEAQQAEAKEWNAMALATATTEGKPSCRIVLLKKVDERGLVFYTNYNSRKARELESNPFAMATLFWSETMRQVCVEGSVERLSRKESEEYFSRRPRGSQIGAWASPQDAVISSYKALEGFFREIEQKYRNDTIPLPLFWGGHRILPCRFEFWSGGKDRLHDRFQYILYKGRWAIERLAP